jgi:molybdopterin molybdotransferase
MLTVQEAVARLLRDVPAPPAREKIRLIDGLGRVLADDAHARINVPPAANSAMDGYAIRFSDCAESQQKIPLSQRVAAGHPPQPLVPGTAARIFTGAEIPQGADTVVIQEDCTADESSVNINVLPKAGDNIRPRGQDLSAGQQMFSRGQRLRAQDLGLLASQGISEVEVYRRLVHHARPVERLGIRSSRSGRGARPVWRNQCAHAASGAIGGRDHHLRWCFRG